MGADHTRPAPPTPPGVRRLLVAVVVPLFALTVIAALVLWPRQDREPVGGADVPRYHGTVTRVVTEPCPPTPEAPEGAGGPCGTATVAAEQGPDAGRQVETPLPAGPGAPRVEVGDKIVLVELIDPADPSMKSYNIAEHQRGTPLIWLLVLFAAAIVAFGRWRGLAALGGLAASFAILLGFVLPGIGGGQPPLLVAIVGAALIMFVVLYLTHGITAQTSVAVLGTLGSLVITGVLGLLATSATHLTGFGSEDATTLSMFQGDVDLHGLLLAGIIIGSLGVLDDVTVTQAATVTELAHANPGLSRRQLYRAATRVGRAHIASTVNTIVLAYAGASLPLLLLLVADSRPVSQILTSEFLAQEIVRSAVATLGLIAAVPLTTALAAIVTTAGRRAPGPEPASPVPPPPRPPTGRDDALEALGGGKSTEATW
ncbi:MULTISPECIES: YibE/F family protein [unclassified Micromonospora]|uniref:YibE/F family protein n=1 Tax=unclassified Micromonospora TaxID=2617518 RepID=UPI0003EEB72D|nr:MULTISPECIES: YibE/F family protein [unclassified Micromonospora]EWM66261.1 membrane protein [Micromonospora sp. M42]MBQ1060823.1 YibE/F family protein [Micromonospora sp. C41]MCK1805038.1 YibE/F family protein [Micromonospora sp. R42106]MCK1830006.1 YibE/F family protein [Micromonospora sp. R42003]MCK1841943.1 YibE/F family protein [Micromonospora sp. R42004]